MSQRGYTFIELLVVTTILLILASAVMPLAKVTSQRQREAELRRNLREMRTAIDRFKDAVDTGRIAASSLEPGNEGYPPDLETLVDGISAANGRIDIAIVRSGDTTGVAGTGLLATVLFDAVAPGSASFNMAGSASAPGGAPVPLQVAAIPAVTVR